MPGPRDWRSDPAIGLARLGTLMAMTEGSPEIGIGVIDGPVAVGHPDLREARLVAVAGHPTACSRVASSGCAHGTFVAGILAARRGSAAPALCPGCTLLVRPVFAEVAAPAASPGEVAAALVDCVQAGARIINLSAATVEPTSRTERELRVALDHAAARGALVVAAAGNQGALGSSVITRNPGVIPVVSYDVAGRPVATSNFAASTGRRGLGAPGDVVSLALHGGVERRLGTSFAAAFVTGALALLWSLFPELQAGRLRDALSAGQRRATIIPPLMDAGAALTRLTRPQSRWPRA